MSNSSESLGWQVISGSPYQIGIKLGAIGRKAVHEHIVSSKIWLEVTDSKYQPIIDHLAKHTQEHFPDVWDELRGLAEGLELPLEKVFAWNCRGDLLLSVPDGCTTILIKNKELIIAHNEDGMPNLKGHCFIVKIKSWEQPEFLSFCYPGSIPGHTFAINEVGLVQAVNNLRLIDCQPKYPRMVLGRALLNCKTLDKAIELIQQNCSSGGFHFSLCQQGYSRLISLEFGAGTASISEVKHQELHVNHATHEAFNLVPQLKTRSSLDRKIRGSELLNRGSVDPLSILWDTSGSGLPIHRSQPDDPDEENTLATAVMRVGVQGVDWEIYDQAHSDPVYFGQGLNRK